MSFSSGGRVPAIRFYMVDDPEQEIWLGEGCLGLPPNLREVIAAWEVFNQMMLDMACIPPAYWGDTDTSEMSDSEADA